MKHKTKNFNLEEDARRKSEIEQYGRLLSLRPSVVHKAKNKYDRNTHKKESMKLLTDSFFILHTSPMALPLIFPMSDWSYRSCSSSYSKVAFVPTFPSIL